MRKPWHELNIGEQVKTTKVVEDLSVVNKSFLEQVKSETPSATWLYINPKNTKTEIFNIFHEEFLNKQFVRYGLVLGRDNKVILSNEKESKSGLILKVHSNLSDKNELDRLMETYRVGALDKWSAHIPVEILKWNKQQFIFYAPKFETSFIYRENELIAVICFMNHMFDGEKINQLTWIWIKETNDEHLRSEIHRQFSKIISNKRDIPVHAVIGNYNAPSIKYFLKLGFEVKWAAVLLG